MKSNAKICGVLVTFNRLAKLKNALKSYDDQKYKPSHLVVINNNSTDGTSEYLQQWINIDSGYNKIVINLDDNIGGSGGFTRGIEEALKLDCDWIYLGDDDAYLGDSLFEKFSLIENKDSDNVGAICSTVDSPDGISYFHRRYINIKKFSFEEIDTTLENYQKEEFNIDLFSFVGVFIKKSTINDIGLPQKDYFIWYDDTEYSFRITRKYKAICIPDLTVYHDCKMADNQFCWKNYYGYRNKMNMLKNNFKKRYYKWFKFMLYCSSILDIFKNPKKGKVKRDAIFDAKRNILGKNEKYLPGKKF